MLPKVAKGWEDHKVERRPSQEDPVYNVDKLMEYYNRARLTNQCLVLALRQLESNRESMELLTKFTDLADMLTYNIIASSKLFEELRKLEQVLEQEKS